ncbi:MAG TPA: outer membrane lipid asymmetry maintenance protein MlaD [Burkholderiales bacterium]|nr:outer membrane lipid asymmetry maintenance protein MlaD [Burkholderiales bacterium]
MSRKAIDVWVGAFVLIGIAALFFLALQVASSSDAFNGGAGYSVQARFENIGGLKPRAPVRSAGVLVGRVTDINFDNQTFEAVVTMNLDKRFAFPKDTAAKVLTSGLLGEQYVGLTPGGDLADLGDGDTIRITQSAIVLENLIGQFLYSKAAGDDQNAPAR